MSATILYGAAILAALVLAFGVYWPRHRRRDLVVAFLGINIGVLAVAALLASSTVTAGLGLGLFGVLSIIRLRSDELAQHEIAYYFAFLALGLVGGLGVTPIWLSAAFLGLIVLTMIIVDHPDLLASHRRQILVVDRAIVDEQELRAHLEHLLAARVTAVTVQELDLVQDTTTVDVRFPLAGGRSSRTGAPTAPGEPAALPETGTAAERAHRPETVVPEAVAR
jgi:hypothetical protein